MISVDGKEDSFSNKVEITKITKESFEQTYEKRKF